jgi:hypothetical protein
MGFFNQPKNRKTREPQLKVLSMQNPSTPSGIEPACDPGYTHSAQNKKSTSKLHQQRILATD